MKKLTLGARIKSLLPTLSISLPAVITGILIFSETNLIDPLTSLLSKTEDENKKEEDTKGEGKEDGEKGTSGKEKSDQKGKGKGGKSKDAQGDGSGDALSTKGDKEDTKGEGELAGGSDENKDGSSRGGQESGKPNAQMEGNGNGEGDTVSDLLGTSETAENGVPEGDDKGNEKGEGNQTGKDNDGEERETDGAKVIGVEGKDGKYEEKPRQGKTGKSRGVAPAFWGYFGEELHEDW